MEDDNLDVPKHGNGDYLHASVKVALGTIPLAGGALAEIFTSIVEAPFEKRKREWMGRVVQVIEDLRRSGLRDDSLKENEAFISAVFYASHLAMKTHQEEKLTALRNAIENVALGVEPDEVIQQIFLNYIDVFTVLHMKLLRFALRPEPSNNTLMGSLKDVLFKTHPDLNEYSELVDQIWKELHDYGFVTSNTLNGGMSISGLRQSHVTPMGNRFLRFITNDDA